MREVAEVARALGDEGRLRALLALRGRELCVCQITELLGLAPSTVSKHMAVLRQARLVASRKSGRWIYYRLAAADASPLVRSALEWALPFLARSAQGRQDATRLEEILQCDPETLCRAQLQKPTRKASFASKP